jgi:effector-binding domain-containing protein
MTRALSLFAALALAGSSLMQAAAQTPPPIQSQPLPAPGTQQTPGAQPTPPPPAPPPPPQASPSTPPAPGGSASTGDAFGTEVMLPARTIVFMQGSGTWDSAFETLVDSFKSVYGFLEKQGIKPAGSALTIYTSTDDTGFQYQAAVPIAEAPANPPKGDIEVGKSPGGKMLKFVHRGSYDAMDTTYEAITNYLDTKQLEAQDTFVEEYVTDPVTTPEDKLVVNVYVPVK